MGRQGSVERDGWRQVQDIPAWPLKSCLFNSRLGITVTPLQVRVPGLSFTLPCTFSHDLHRWSVTGKHCYLHLDMLVPFCTMGVFTPGAPLERTVPLKGLSVLRNIPWCDYRGRTTPARFFSSVQKQFIPTTEILWSSPCYKINSCLLT